MRALILLAVACSLLLLTVAPAPAQIQGAVDRYTTAIGAPRYSDFVVLGGGPMPPFVPGAGVSLATWFWPYLSVTGFLPPGLIGPPPH